MTDEYKSLKSRSTFTVTGDRERAFITCSGEAASNTKVQAEILRIRKGGCDFATAAWTARMLGKNLLNQMRKKMNEQQIQLSSANAHKTESTTAKSSSTNTSRRHT